MSTLRELKGRIGSAASSEKITGAMKMISSAKMHKAEQMLARVVPFRNQLQTIMGNLMSADAVYSSELTETREVQTVALVVTGSDDGLCGAYNINIFKKLLMRIKELRSGGNLKVIVYPVGKKMEKAVAKLNMSNVTVERTGVLSKATAEEVKLLTERLKNDFLSHKVDLVEVVSMQFISAGKQLLRSLQLLPVSADAFGELPANSNRLYIFEPDANTIYNALLPLYVISMMQEVFLQNAASEQAARVMAMQSANDNAQKLLESLKLEYNKLRQQGITTELLDILGGQVEK